MKPSQLQIIVLFCLSVEFVHSLKDGFCPARNVLLPCTCHELNKGLEINCEGIWPRENLLKTFKNIRDNVHDSSNIYLKLKDADLSTLPSGLFDRLEIRHLMAHKCLISSIEVSTFARIQNHIESIDLSENRLTEIPVALKNLASLLSLNVNFNQVEVLDDNALEGLVSLVRLSLFGNKIRVVRPSSFLGASKNLTRLNLGGNRLTHIPTSALRPLRSLQRLQLHENQIQVVGPQTFSSLASSSTIDALNLAHNQLQRLESRIFSELSNLSSLDLGGNRISQIEPEAFFGLEQSLEWLKLGGNKLTAIPGNALQKLTKLRELDLRDNQIQQIEANNFRSFGKNVKFLYLQKNRISRIDVKAFEALTSLEWLNLAGNQLTTLSEATIEPLLKNLLIFDISENPIECSCSIVWLNRTSSILNERNKAAHNNIANIDAGKCLMRTESMTSNRTSAYTSIIDATNSLECSGALRTVHLHLHLVVAVSTLFLFSILCKSIQ